MTTASKTLIKPNLDDARLTRRMDGKDQHGTNVNLDVIEERPLTLFLNGQEIITMMTVGDHPKYLAVGYLLNQQMLRHDDTITSIDYDADIDTVVVRTERQTDYEEKMKKKTRTSGCAVGTVFGDIMESFDSMVLDTHHTTSKATLAGLLKAINTTPSLYLKAGAIHGCVLCQQETMLLYMEDVGRHNAVDKIAGYMFLNRMPPEDKLFYTTGRLTSEMIIKTVMMGIPILVSRSGFTAWGVELARRANLTLVGRARGERFMVLAGAHRLV